MKPIEGSKAIKYDDESLEQKQKKYSKLFDEKLDEIQELSREIDYKNLNYDFIKKACGSINFNGYNGPFAPFQKNRRCRHIARNGRRRSKKDLKENLVK